MKERLAAIDWSALSHAYGPATDIPELLLQLLNDFRARGKVLWELYGNLYHQGTRYEATPVAVPFLVEIAQKLTGRDQAQIWEFIARCIAGDFTVTHEHDSAYGSLWGGPEQTDTSADILRAIEVAASGGIEAAKQQLSAENAALRRAVAFFLSCSHQREEQYQISAALWGAYQREPHAPTRAVIAFALIHTIPQKDEAQIFLLVEDPHPLVRVVASMTLVQRCKDRAPNAALLCLEEAKNASDELTQDYQELPIFSSDLTEDIAVILHKITP